jgi:hypothetical protein
MRSERGFRHNPRVEGRPSLRAATPSAPRRALARIRLGLGGLCGTLALFLAVLELELVTLPERLYGDDVFFVWCIVRDRVFAEHVLYLPIARPWTRAFAEQGVDPFLALRVLAAVGMAAGVALLFAAARRRGVSTLLAAAVALFVATSNAPWFFGRAAEVHGLQLAAFGLLAWCVAGLRTDAAPVRMLAVALAFGVMVGAHKTSSLLLPGVVCAYAFATPGRALAARRRDGAWFAAGGLLSLAAMAGFRHAATGAWFSAQETVDYWTAGFPVLVGNLAPARLARYVADAWIAPAFASAVLGAVAAGALLLARPRALAALLALALPYAIVLPLFGWAERGAYLIVLLPIVAWAVVGPWLAAPELDEPARRRAHRAMLAACAIAGAGALAKPDELAHTLGTGGMLAALGAAFLLGLAAAPRFRRATPGGGGGPLASERRGARGLLLGRAGLALAACQLVGSARDLAAWSSETPLMDWGRDAAAAVGPDNLLISTGFQEHYLLWLLDRPWAPPYRGTWAYANALGTLGPNPVDVGSHYAKLPAGAEQALAEGRRVFLSEPVLRHFEFDPLRGAAVRELRARFDLAPVDRGRFHGFELRRKAE